MAQIASLSNWRCIHRGVSIMRLALGYETGLPNDWWYRPEGGLGYNGCTDEIRQILQSFPQHDVAVFCPSEYAKRWELRPEEYTEKNTLYTLVGSEEWQDDHIFAFSYFHNKNLNIHFVVGNPTFNDEHLLAYVIAVSIKKHTT